MKQKLTYLFNKIISYKRYINIILYITILIISIICIVFAYTTNKHNKTLKKQIELENNIIDSLLSRKMNLIDCSLNVTDKSKSIIYGKYNKGNITMPQEKIYVLKIDSTGVSF